MGHVVETHRDSGVSCGKGDLAKVLQRLQIAGGAHHVLGLGKLQNGAAGLLIGVAHRVDDFLLGDVEGAQAIGIEHDLVLAHHAADGGDLGDIRHRLELVLQEPVLQRAQLRQVPRTALVHERVLIDPAHAGRVRPERRLGAGGQARLHLVQIFQYARARPVRIGAIVE